MYPAPPCELGDQAGTDHEQRSPVEDRPFNKEGDSRQETEQQHHFARQHE